MIGAITFMSIGVLCFAVIMMKWKADLRFQNVMKTVFRVRIKKPIENWYDTT